VAAACLAASAFAYESAAAHGLDGAGLALGAGAHASLFVDAQPVDRMGWRRDAGAVLEPASALGVRAGLRYEPFHWLSLELSAASMRPAAGTLGDRAPAPRALAGATLRSPDGWSASLFVSYLGQRQLVEDESVRWRSTSLVNARFSRSLTSSTRLTFDVFNVFDERMTDLGYFETSRLWSTTAGTTRNFLFHPAEPRSFRILLRATF
jgi:hypothetical protein